MTLSCLSLRLIAEPAFGTGKYPRAQKRALGIFPVPTGRMARYSAADSDAAVGSHTWGVTMLSNVTANRPTHAPLLRAGLPVPPECALCGGRHLGGSWLVSGPVGTTQILWVCLDCQHMLARGVDADGVLGG